MKKFGKILNVTWRLVFLSVAGVIDTIATVIMLLAGVLQYICTLGKSNSCFCSITDIWSPWKWYFKVIRAYLKYDSPNMDDLYQKMYQEPDSVAPPTQKQRLTKISPRFEIPQVSLNPFSVLEGLVVAYDVGTIGYVIAIVALSLLPVRTGFVKFASPKPVINKPTAKLEHRESESEIQQSELGPWLTEKEALTHKKEAGFTNLALLSDTGEVKYSASYILDTTSSIWQTSFHPNVANYEINNGTVTFRDSRENTFTLNLNQPFMFEGAKLTFVFDKGGLKQTATNVSALKVKEELK